MSEKKVLLLGDKDSVFVYNFAIELKNLGYDVHIFDLYRLVLCNWERKIIQEFPLPPGFLDHIPKFGYLVKKILLRRIYCRLNGLYDICHIHYNLKVYSDVARTVAGIGKKLVVSVWGSDYYKKSDRERRIQRKIYRRACLITFATEQTRMDFLDYYKNDYRAKTRILRLGLRPLEYIDKVRSENKNVAKKTIGLPPDSIIIVCGYNAKPHQNHIAVLESVFPLVNSLPKKTFFVFPMVYGDEDYRKKLEVFLRESGLSYRILDTFMSDMDIARLRYITDIMVNVQETDQLSGTFQEHIYAGNVAICGSWLPYRILEHRGVFFLTVDSPNETGEKILHVLSRLDEYRKRSENNPAAIGDLGRWDIIMKDWDKAYQNLLKND